MMSIEKTAKTAEEAIQLALDELGLPRERVKVEILEEGRSLFGILGSTQARVRVTAETTIGEHVAQLLAEITKHMGVDATAKVVEEDETQAVIDIEGEELGLLIGKHGNTLAALQHLVGLMANKGQETRKRVILDAEGYRQRREESLRHLALSCARKARQSGQPITIEPLLPHERRIVHTALVDDPGVTTHSVGEDPTRRVVIEPRGGGEQAEPAGRESRPARGRRHDRGRPHREARAPAEDQPVSEEAAAQQAEYERRGDEPEPAAEEARGPDEEQPQA